MPEKVLALLLGAAVAVVTWSLLVPWDLSEVDADGFPLDRGGDDHAGAIALVVAVVVSIAIALLPPPRTRPVAAWFATGGLVAWATLFAWRAGTAETSGANLFLVPLVIIVLPVTVAAPLVVRHLAGRLTDSPTATDDRS